VCACRPARGKTASIDKRAAGLGRLFLQTVTQADQGVDVGFLRAPLKIGKTPSR
jgi:hypothetical protein